MKVLRLVLQAHAKAQRAFAKFILHVVDFAIHCAFQSSPKVNTILTTMASQHWLQWHWRFRHFCLWRFGDWANGLRSLVIFPELECFALLDVGYICNSILFTNSCITWGLIDQIMTTLRIRTVRVLPSLKMDTTSFQVTMILLTNWHWVRLSTLELVQIIFHLFISQSIYFVHDILEWLQWIRMGDSLCLSNQWINLFKYQPNIYQLLTILVFTSPLPLCDRKWCMESLSHFLHEIALLCMNQLYNTVFFWQYSAQELFRKGGSDGVVILVGFVGIHNKNHLCSMR